MRILFINGSPNKTGNTAKLAAELLKGHEYQTLNLTDYTIGAYGQALPGDGLDTVIAAMEQAEVIVMGSPLYWHNLCGSGRTDRDRFYGRVEEGGLSGRRLYFVFQGAAPEKWMLEAGEYTMKRFAALYGMTYGGMATHPGGGFPSVQDPLTRSFSGKNKKSAIASRDGAFLRLFPLHPRCGSHGNGTED